MHCPWVQIFDKDLNRLIYLGQEYETLEMFSKQERRKLKVFGQCVNYIICSLDFRYTEAVVRRYSLEQVLLKITQCWSFLLRMLQAFRPAILLKRDSSIGAFLRNLQNLQGHLFYRTLRWLLLELSYELSHYCI